MSDTGAAGAAEDPLDRLRERLDEVDTLPVTDHPQLFEEVNETIVGELAAMEEV
jgi:hypothetical protein